MKNRKEEFLVRGNHSTISACTLPPWIPSEIVDTMNETFGALLRSDLVALMHENNTCFRNRCNSTGSETLSLDSSAGSDMEFTHQTLSSPLG